MQEYSLEKNEHEDFAIKKVFQLLIASEAVDKEDLKVACQSLVTPKAIKSCIQQFCKLSKAQLKNSSESASILAEIVRSYSKPTSNSPTLGYPESYFSFHGRNEDTLSLPAIEWSSFRGYTINLWLNIRITRENSVNQSGEFSLFKFATSDDAGVHATLAHIKGNQFLLSIRSAGITIASRVGTSKRWNDVKKEINLIPNTWQMLTISHSLRYVRKSKVIFYVNAVKQMENELNYPANLTTVARCTIGGGTCSADLTTFAMFEDEIPLRVIQLFYNLGPTYTCFFDALPASSRCIRNSFTPLTVASFNTKMANLLSKLHVLSIYDAKNEVDKGIYLQWKSHNSVVNDGIHFSFQNLQSQGQERFARLSGGATKVCLNGLQDMWYQYGGITAAIMMFRTICSCSRETSRSQYSLNDPFSPYEQVLAELLTFLRRLLKGNPVNRQEMLQTYGFYLLTHLLRSASPNVLSINVAKNCASLVTSTREHYVDSEESTNNDLPLPLNPLYAAGVCGLLSDFSLWSIASPKTQVALLESLVEMTVEEPAALYQLLGIQKLLDIIRLYFCFNPSSKTNASSSAPVYYSGVDLAIWWKSCIDSLFKMVHVFLQHLLLSTNNPTEIWLVVNYSGRKVILGNEAYNSVRAISQFLLDCQDKFVLPALLDLLYVLVKEDESYVFISLLLYHQGFNSLLYLLQRRVDSLRLLALPLFIYLLEWAENEGSVILQVLYKVSQEITASGNANSVISSSPGETPVRSAGPTKLDPSSIYSISLIRKISLRYVDTIVEVYSNSIETLSKIPLVGVLPFLAVLLPKTDRSCQERNFMALSVLLKTDKSQQEQLSHRPQWVDWLISFLVFSDGDEEHLILQTTDELVLDCIVTMICAQMTTDGGWKVWRRAIVAFERKGRSLKKELISSPRSLTLSIHDDIHNNTVQLWLQCVAIRVLQRISRDRPILTRVLASNIEKLLILVDERLLTRKQDDFTSPPSTFIPSSSTFAFSDEQLALINGMLEITTLLLSSTNRNHRSGLRPALRMVQRLFPYVTFDLAKRFVNLLQVALEQEVTAGSVMHIYDMSSRDMLLSALCSLRRAISTTPFPECRNLFRSLVLTLARGGLFNYETNAWKAESLDGLNDADAVAYVFEQLAIQMNTMDMSCLDEEADMISLFPRFPLLDTSEQMDSFHLSGENLGPGSVAESPISDAEAEIEQSRASQNVQVRQDREKVRIHGVELARVDASNWTDRHWKLFEGRLLSELQIFDRYTKVEESSSKLELEQQEKEAQRRCCLFITQGNQFQLDQHETPFPARIRQRLRAQLISLDDPHPEIHGLINSPKARKTSLTESSPLLREVGRAIAKQGGGIRDVTTEETVQDSELTEQQLVDIDFPQTDIEIEIEVQKNEELGEEKQEENEEENAAIRRRIALQALNNVPPSTIDLGPSSGNLVFDKTNSINCICRMVLPIGLVCGTFYITDINLIFIPFPRDSEMPWPPSRDDQAPGLEPCHYWLRSSLTDIFLRRYRLRDSALELFFKNGTSYFFEFPKEHRDDIARSIRSSVFRESLTATALRYTVDWHERRISNFDYLMALNTLAGRSYNDLTQYPIFPWILNDYTSPSINLESKDVYRDLTKPVGALNSQRLKEFWDRYESFDDPDIPKFLYGSHYSTCAGVVLYFLLRLQPFTNLHIKTQDGRFDVADRLFASIPETWKMCNSSMSEVKELTPEFFCNPEFLRNLNSLPLGTRQDDKIVGDVELPAWCDSPECFIELNRKALESEHVSKNIHHWIDLIFGYKQRGKAALEASNVFYYLTYYGLVDVDSIEDVSLRSATELQIAHFGQCPIQIFNHPHPKRRSRSRVHRPLITAFKDSSMAAIRRRQWDSLTVDPLGPTAILAIKILPGRIITVNELGVVEAYHWGFESAPLVSPSSPSSASSPSSSTSPPTLISALSDDEMDGYIDTNSMQLPQHHCPWTLHVERDQSPFDVVPRVPLPTLSNQQVPSVLCPVMGSIVALTESGKCIITAGRLSGSLAVRYVDIDTGQLLSGITIMTQCAAITCLCTCPFSKHEDLVLTGSSDRLVMLWMIRDIDSKMRLTRRPLLVLRGHEHPIIACAINAAIGISATCSLFDCLVHCIETGELLFVFHPPEDWTFRYVVLSHRGFVVTYSTKIKDNQSLLQVYSLSGRLRKMSVFPYRLESLAITSDGEVLVTGSSKGICRFYRCVDLVMIQYYESDITKAINAISVGPEKGETLAVAGLEDGRLVIHRLPDADGSISLFGHFEKLIGINSKIKLVKGTVQQAQSLAITTIDTARQATSTAKNIAEEAIVEAKSLVKGFLGYLGSGKGGGTQTSKQ